LHFIENETVCRNRIILKYFNEATTDNCGQCDVCRDQIKKAKHHHDFETVKAQIVSLANGKPFLMQDFGAQIKDKKLLANVIEWMMNNGKLERTEDLRFRLL